MKGFEQLVLIGLGLIIMLLGAIFFLLVNYLSETKDENYKDSS